MRHVLSFMLWAFSVLVNGLMSVNAPRPMPPVVRFNEQPFAKRVYGKALGACASFRMLLQRLWRTACHVPGWAPAYQRAGVLNLYLDPLPVFPYQQAPQKENMPRSVHIRDLHVRVSGTIDVAGGTTDGTLNSEAIARLIRRFTVRWDSFDLVEPMEARILAALGRRLVGQPLPGTPVTIPGVQTTNFELNFFVPFAREYNADPFNTALPPLVVRKEFVVEIEWETARTTAASSLGSGAIITGGDRVVTLSDVQAEILPRQARNAAKPWYIPQITTYHTEQFVAANPRLVLDIDQQEAFDGILFRFLDGPLQSPADLLNTITFRTKGQIILEDITDRQLRVIEQNKFRGVLDASEVGNFFFQFSDGGKLGNVVNPRELTLPKFEFDVSTPPVGPSVVQAVAMELLSIPDVTVR